MKLLILLSMVMVAAHAQDQFVDDYYTQKVAPIVERCRQQYNVEQSDVNRILQGTLTDANPAKRIQEFVTCTLEGYLIFDTNTGVLDQPKATDFFERLTGKTYDEVITAVSKCGAITGEPICYTGWKIHRCFQDVKLY